MRYKIVGSNSKFLNGPWLRALPACAALLMACSWAGCVPAGLPDPGSYDARTGPPQWAETQARRHLRMLATGPSGERLSSYDRASYVAESLGQYGWQPAFRDEFRHFSPGRPASGLSILGYVSGRDPLRRDELVILACEIRGEATDVSNPAGGDSDRPVAALLEAARVLSAMASHEGGPDRTIMVAFWATDSLGAAGRDAWLNNPTWPADAVVRYIQIGGGPAPDIPPMDPDRRIVVEPSRKAGGPLGPFEISELAHRAVQATAEAAWEHDAASRVPPAPER